MIRSKFVSCLEKGADPNVRSGQGRTALLIAAGLTGTEETVTLLLDKGVDGKAQLTAEGRGAVTLAALGGNAAVVRLLVDRNAVSRPFMLPALGCRPCVDILLPLASERELSAALPETILTGDAPLIRQLLDRGAKSGPNALQAAALSPTPVPADLIRTVINRGAKVDSRTSFGISVIDLAARQGSTAANFELSPREQRRWNGKHRHSGRSRYGQLYPGRHGGGELSW